MTDNIKFLYPVKYPSRKRGMTFIDKLRQCWSQIEIWKLCNPRRRKIIPEGKSDMQKEMVRQENGKNANISQ